MTKHFVLHDLSMFPIVTFQPELAQAGYAPVWARELETLLDWREPFVIVTPIAPRAEGNADYRCRHYWLKESHESLALCCCGHIGVEPNPRRRERLRASSADLESRYGVNQYVVADEVIAQKIAKLLLSSVSDVTLIPDQA